MSIKECPWKEFNSECTNQCLSPSADDPQKQIEYCWEEYLFDYLYSDQVEFDKTHPLSLEQCKDLIYEICDRYAVDRPRVGDGRGYANARACYGLIHLPRFFREELSTIHEACHLICAFIAPTESAHGSTFVRLCIYHFAKYIEALDVGVLEKTAALFDLEVGDRLKCLPPPWIKVKAMVAQRKIVKGFSLMRQEAEQNAVRLAAKERSERKKYEKMSFKLSHEMWPDED